MKTSYVVVLFVSMMITLVSFGQGTVTTVPIGTNGNPLGFIEYLPENYAAKDDHPVILFWHGTGGAGNGNSDLSKMYSRGPFRVMTAGNWPVLNQHGEPPAEDFVVIGPQSPNQFPSPTETLQMINYILANYNVDPERLYLTGLSAGANNTWASLVYHYEYIAAAIPIGSNADWTASSACEFGEVPIWAFNGSDDFITTTSQHIAAVEAVNACVPAFNPQAKITIYEGVGHAGWNQTYDLSGMDDPLDPSYDPFNMSIYDWLLQFTLSNRGTGGDTPNIPPNADAGPDQVIDEGDTLVLDGSGSFDPDGSIAAYSWESMVSPVEGEMEQIFVNFTDAGFSSPSGWNTFDHGLTAGTRLNNLRNAEGDLTVIDLELKTSWSGQRDGGAVTGSDSGVFPDIVIDGLYYTNSDPERIEIKQLDTARSYSFTFFGSRATGGDKTTVFEINGQKDSLQASNNSTAVVEIADVSPDEDGRIEISISRGELADYAYLNAMVITYGGGIPIENKDQSVATVINPVPGQYVFSLSVEDDLGAISSDQISVQVNALIPNEGPVANISAVSEVSLPLDSVQLDGSGSFDPDGSIVSQEWSILNYPAGNPGLIVDPGSLITLLQNMVAGSYTVQLLVTDNNGVSDSTTATISVLPAPNQAPEAVIEIGSSDLFVGDDLTLVGGSSSDPDGSIVSYQWSVAEAPSPDSSSLQNATSADALLINLSEGLYDVQLIVTDDEGAADTTSTGFEVLQVPNQPPMAIANSESSITLPDDNLIIDGSESNDPDGSITTVQWEIQSAPLGSSSEIVDQTQLVTTITNLVEGSYQLKLLVEDNDSDVDSTFLDFDVLPDPNLPPTAVAGSDTTITLPIDSLALNASQSSDPEGLLSAFMWSILSSPLGSSSYFDDSSAASTLIKDLVEGEYSLLLTVTDDGGLQDADTLMINVLPVPNVPPVAQIVADAQITLPVDSVILDGTNSYDSDGTIASVHWERLITPLGDSSEITENGLTATLKDVIEGFYQIQLIVTDDQGANDTTQVNIEVLPAPNVRPLAVIQMDSVVQLPLDSLVLDGLSSSDEDGLISSFFWSIEEAPSGSSSVIAEPNNPITSVSVLHEGFYTIQLTVTDNEGAQDSTQSSFNVLPEPNQPPIAMITGDSIFALPIDTITLDGSASGDLDGDIAAVSWSLLSEPLESSALIQDDESLITSLTGIIEGVYITQLIVVDDDGATDTAVYTFRTVIPVNQEPIIQVNNRITVTQGPVVIDASSSYDADGNIVVVSWRLIAEPAPDSTYVQVDFNVPDAVTSPGWNMVSGDYFAGATWQNLRTSQEIPTDYSLSLMSNWNQARRDGGAVGGDAGPFPDAVMDGTYWTNDGPENILISGLPVDKSMGLSIFSGRAASGNRTTVFEVDGQKDSVNASFNYSLLHFSDVSANSNGDLSIEISLGQNAAYGYLNALKLEIPNEGAQLSQIESLITELSGIRTGIYELELTISDNEGAESVDTVFVEVLDPSAIGSISRFVWNDIAGSSIASLISVSEFPEFPDEIHEETSFEAPSNQGDNYGTRMVGYLHPTVSGEYTLWISGDDECELFLSIDADESNKSMIANVPGWSRSGQWDKYPEQQSAAIYMEAGHVYFIEALHKERTGGDNLAVAWEQPGGAREIIDGQFLSPYGLTTNQFRRSSNTSTLNNQESIMVFPNPVGEYLEFQTQIEGRFELLTLAGRVLIEGFTKSANISNQVEVESLEPGVYLLRVIGENVSESVMLKKI